MKDHLLQLVAQGPTERRLNLAREYLQVYLLRLLHEQGAPTGLAFVGGTALRLLYNLPRFSEDLDFSYHAPEAQDTPAAQDTPEARDTAEQLADLFRNTKAKLANAGYQVSARLRTVRTVAQAIFRFEGILAEIAWTTDHRRRLAIKVEVDTEPPAGAVLTSTLIQRFFPIALRHHDLPSLFAGKLHAVLTRPFTKGRDWYDLVWYLTEQRGLEPNLLLLRLTLAQTGHQQIDPARWREEIRDKLNALDWPTVVADVRPFLERPTDLDQLSPDLVRALLGSRR